VRAIERFGSEALQRRIVPAVCRGEMVIAIGMSEPDAGSALTDLKTRGVIRGDKVVVFLHAWVRLHGATDWTGGRFADGFVFRDGKITEYRTFWERAQALAWAGIPTNPVDPRAGR